MIGILAVEDGGAGLLRHGPGLISAKQVKWPVVGVLAVEDEGAGLLWHGPGLISAG